MQTLMVTHVYYSDMNLTDCCKIKPSNSPRCLSECNSFYPLHTDKVLFSAGSTNTRVYDYVFAVQDLDFYLEVGGFPSV